MPGVSDCGAVERPAVYMISAPARVYRARRLSLVAAIWMAIAVPIVLARSIFCARLCVGNRLLWFLFRF